MIGKALDNSRGTAVTLSGLNINWRPDTTTGLDSLWAHLQKLAYLNAVGFSELARIFDSKGVGRWGANDRRLDHFRRLDVTKLARAICVPEHRMEMLLPSAYGIESDLANVLRFCPVCIRRGFHSAAFQLKAVLRCPVHDVMLESKCPGCRYTIPYLFGSGLRTPFACRCGWKFWPGITAQRWPRSLTARQEIVFRSLYRWSGRFRKADSRRTSGEWGSRWMPLDNTGPLACFEPIDGWSPEHFGLGKRNVITTTYRGHWRRSRLADTVPINVLRDFPLGVEKLYPRFDGALGRQWSRKMVAVDEKIKRRLGTHRDCAIEASGFGEGLVSYRGMCCLGMAYHRWYQWVSIASWFEPLPEKRFTTRGCIEAAVCTHLALVATNTSVGERELLPPLVTWLAMKIYEAWSFATYADQLGRITREWHSRTQVMQYSLDPLSELAHPYAAMLATIATHPVIAYYPGGVMPPKVKYFVSMGNDLLERFAVSKCEIQKRHPKGVMHLLPDVYRTNPRSKWAPRY